MANPDGGDVLQMLYHVLPSIKQVYDVFLVIIFKKIKLLYLFLHLLIQIWSQNHNCNYLNVFLPFLFIIFQGQ